MGPASCRSLSGGQPVDAKLVDKLRKILALTNSPEEHEAAAAAEHLQRLLTQHNLDIADLEQRGAATKPGVVKGAHDLGKAAFTWKLNLAEVVAEYYFVHPLVDRKAKTVVFIGRPDNVDSMKMLYEWLMEQTKAISASERRAHIAKTGEHIDPLRWQVNFGLGVVSRLGQRLHELSKRRAADVTEHALVLSHKSEISDWLEANGLWRIDGRETAAAKASREQWERYTKDKDELKAACEAAGDMEPETPEQLAARAEADRKAEAKAARNAKRRTGRTSIARYDPEQARKDEQGWNARQAGRDSADKINLEPFLGDGSKANKGSLR